MVAERRMNRAQMDEVYRAFVRMYKCLGLYLGKAIPELWVSRSFLGGMIRDKRTKDSWPVVRADDLDVEEVCLIKGVERAEGRWRMGKDRAPAAA